MSCVWLADECQVSGIQELCWGFLEMKCISAQKTERERDSLPSSFHLFQFNLTKTKSDFFSNNLVSNSSSEFFFFFFVCNSISASVRKMKLISSFAFIYLPYSTDRRNMSGHFCVGETAAAASSGTWELFASEEMCDLRSSWFDSMSSFRSDIKIRGDRGLEVCWWLV